MQKRVILLFILFISVLQIVKLTSSFGIPTSDFSQTIAETIDTNGRNIKLIIQNIVNSRELCIDPLNFPFVFDVFKSRQVLYLQIDNVQQSTGVFYEQWFNYEHCPRISGYLTHNREHFINAGEFYEEENQLKMQIRHVGGDCRVGTYNDCLQSLPYYDSVEVLSVPIPQNGQCAPSQWSPCCDENRAYRDNSYICADLIDREPLVLGSPHCGWRVRPIFRTCSGSSDICNGDFLEGPWVTNPPYRAPTPEFCNNQDDDCDGEVDENDNGRSTCECFDEIDNDGDFLIDFNDPACDSGPFGLPIGKKEMEATTQCQNNIDDDGDGSIDFSNTQTATRGDFSCSSPIDNDETNPKSQCQDRQDNDHDTRVDMEDPGCVNSQDNDERDSTFQCNDGIDNDHDGVIDYPNDLGCASETSNTEYDSNAGTNQLRCEQQGYEWTSFGRCCGMKLSQKPGVSGWEQEEATCSDSFDNDCDNLIDEDTNHGGSCPLKCYDGTLAGSCNPNAPPYRCVLNSWGVPWFINDARSCSCPQGYIEDSEHPGFCILEIRNPIDLAFIRRRI